MPDYKRSEHSSQARIGWTRPKPSNMALFESDDALRAALEESLRSISSNEASSSYYAQGTVDDLNPGLVIDGIGSIGMPISEPDVQRIIQISRQAPFGKGNETIVDTSVRRTWEVDTSRLHLNHPKWEERKLLMLHDVTKQLGIARGCDIAQVELYKLFIYEPGALFKAHTEYVDLMTFKTVC